MEHSVVPGSVPEGAADALDRHAAYTVSLAVRRAQLHGDPVAERPSGVAVGCARYPASREDNCLLVTACVGVDQVAADARPLVEGAAPAVTLLGPGAEVTAAGLAASGWSTGVHRVLAMAPVRWSGPEGPGRAEEVQLSDTAGLTRALWAEDIDDAGVVDQLVARESRTAAAVPVVVRAVLADGVVVASGQLRIDGPTACIESVQTTPGGRRRGSGDAVLAALVVAAQQAGCDVLLLEADAEDWPRHWYGRRGFRDVGAVHHGHRATGAQAATQGT